MAGSQKVSLPAAFDDLDIGITLRDPKTGALLDLNERVQQLYGYSRENLLKMEIGDYTPVSKKFSQEKAVRRIQAAAAGDSQVFEWRIERANGEQIWVRVRLNQTTIDGTTCVLAEIRDITEYKARERRLRLLNRIVRHNLRNETNVLIGYADRLKKAIEEESLQEEVETILEISMEIGTLSNSVQQIEDIAEPDATQRSPTNINGLVKNIVTETQVDHSEVDLTVNVQDDICVNADKGLRYAIEHAVDNAIVHNDQDIPSVKVLTAIDSDTGLGEISIIDNGPTISDVEINVLNEDVMASTTYHGSGVGLWVMKWCVHSLGGELIFEKNSPRGNVVRFLLPQVDPSKDEDNSDSHFSCAE
ncbi:PAS domain-containing sensor histidine kinase [Natrinema sp. DC36]|uniref:PAS domain-containing sensor histidine kinase n=1 Tax=Natrinema sp. DC36 TaxID=2878680 RepID=UPI001CF00E22|nr:PAS domain-containing sensor histidine kinase [Natrinema sp. DC36]